MTIAFLGTGMLGSGFVRHLLETGPKVRVWNRTPDKAAPLVEAGALLCATPAEAVDRAERVHLCLSNDAAVDEVLEALRPALSPHAVIIDHTTTSPEGAAARAQRMGEAFLHAPVFMSPAAARDAKGIMMCSGPSATFIKVDAALAAMTGDLWYLGDDPRRAASFKLLGNAMLISVAAGVADVLTLANSLGVSGPDALEVLIRLSPGKAIEVRGKKMAAGDFSATFELAMARKDLGLMLDALGDLPLASLRAIAGRVDDLLARGHAKDDLGVLAVDAVPRK